MAGVGGREFFIDDFEDPDEVSRVVEIACKDVLTRTGGAGFPVLCGINHDDTISWVKEGVERAVANALVYHSSLRERGRCTEREVEEWLRRRRCGDEERILIVEVDASRGWEASHCLVVDGGGFSFENLVMRTVGYCTVVREAPDASQ